MKILRFLFCLSFFLFVSAQSFAELVRFFESIQDVPLMNGLSERIDETITFDKPDGRVVESVAEVHGVSVESVRQYYVTALPQFGWQHTGQDRFLRGHESLELVFENHGGFDVMRVLIRPR